MPRNLIISGGIFHPFEESSRALSDTLQDIGVRSDTTNDVDGGIESLACGDYEMVTVNALRWGMMTADKYEPYRDQWAYEMPQSSRDGLTTFVRSGGTLLGMHTASICFDDWSEWSALLGGCWQWGSSHHPPLGPVTVRPTQCPHVISDGVQVFNLTDEIYHGLCLEADVVPLFEGECAAGDGPQPVVWAREYGNGRVVYDALGHDAASINQPQHRQLIQQAAGWLLAGD